MFAAISRDWGNGGGAKGRKPVVFYGSGELAEIGFICLQETDLTLVAVVDTCERERFFGVPTFDRTCAADALKLAGPHARVLVMEAVRSKELESEILALGEAGRRAIWF